jgi:hypothetical protein
VQVDVGVVGLGLLMELVVGQLVGCLLEEVVVQQFVETLWGWY